VPRVLSLQSLVAHGHVGNRVAVLVLEALGVDVLAVPTAILSNHTGYPTAARTSFGAADTNRLLEGLDEIGALAGLDAVLVGYTGSRDAAAAAARAIDRARELTPALLVVVDPAMGDEGRGMFVPDDVAGAVAGLLVPRATIVVPNAFELRLLAERADGSVPAPDAAAGPGASLDADRLLADADALRAAGPRAVVVTSAGGGPAEVDVVVVEAEVHVIATPRLPVAVGGAGDLLAAVLTAALVSGADAVASARRAVDATAAVLAASAAAGGRDLALVAARASLVDPPPVARVTRLR
jgi:pyridoxine kinase